MLTMDDLDWFMTYLTETSILVSPHKVIFFDPFVDFDEGVAVVD